MENLRIWNQVRGTLSASKLDQNEVVYNFWGGKKNLGCKNNSGVKKVSIPPARFPQQVCLQIKICCVCALISYVVVDRIK